MARYSVALDVITQIYVRGGFVPQNTDTGQDVVVVLDEAQGNGAVTLQFGAMRLSYCPDVPLVYMI